MAVNYRFRSPLKQVLMFCFLVVVIAGSTCRPRCKLGLESNGYRTCIAKDTRCKKSLNGVDRCYKTLPVPRNLKYLEVLIDDVKLPEVVYERNFESNIVTVTGSERLVKKVKLIRNRPQINSPGQWFMNVCDVEFYAAGKFKE